MSVSVVKKGVKKTITQEARYSCVNINFIYSDRVFFLGPHKTFIECGTPSPPPLPPPPLSFPLGLMDDDDRPTCIPMNGAILHRVRPQNSTRTRPPVVASFVSFTRTQLDTVCPIPCVVASRRPQKKREPAKINLIHQRSGPAAIVVFYTSSSSSSSSASWRHQCNSKTKCIITREEL